jgi:glycosyltransferase involved in cell wall biosynthesis
MRPGKEIVPLYWFLDRLILSSALVKERIDLFHATGFSEPCFATVAPSPHYVTVLTVYDLIPWLFPTEYYRTLQARLVRGYLYRLRLRAVRESDRIIALSEACKRDIAAVFQVPPQKIAAVPLAVGEEFYPVTEEHHIKAVLAKYGIRGKYLLYLGGLDYRKNLFTLLHAYKSLLERDLWKGRLVIAGHGVKRETIKVQQMVRSLGLRENVVLPGFIAGEDLPALYSGAQVFVFPSLYEGFGLPPLEAMACGTPVITSDVSSLPDIVGDAAITIDPHNAQELAGAILHILEDPELRVRLQNKGLARAKIFSWEETAKRTLEIYEEVFAERRL